MLLSNDNKEKNELQTINNCETRRVRPNSTLRPEKKICYCTTFSRTEIVRLHAINGINASSSLCVSDLTREVHNCWRPTWGQEAFGKYRIPESQDRLCDGVNYERRSRFPTKHRPTERFSRTDDRLPNRAPQLIIGYLGNRRRQHRQQPTRWIKDILCMKQYNTINRH